MQELQTLDIEQMSAFITSLCVSVIGIAFFVGFAVKKVLQFLKSF